MLGTKLLMSSKSVIPIRIDSFTTAGSYTWVAPAGVTLVTRLTGRGGSGYSAATWTASTGYLYLANGLYTYSSTPDPAWTTIGSSLTYETAQSAMNNFLAQFNSVTTSSSGSYHTMYFRNYHYLNGTYYYHDSNYGNRLYRRTGTPTAAGSLVGRSGSVGTSGSWTSYAQNVQINITQNYYGTSSSAFGYNFSGTNNTNPTTITYNNIAVTPGQSYTIVVGTNQTSPATSFIEIEY